jgi:G:T-mismatch repair DNA endonuclease (very short patch repair protein)
MGAASDDAKPGADGSLGFGHFECASAPTAQNPIHGNKDTEIKLAKLFWANGITSWRRYQPVFGRPDFVFRKQRLAVFVGGWFAALQKCFP